MTTFPSLDEYTQAKQSRQASQLSALSQIMAQPETSWADELFSRWPHKLPRAVRKALPKPALHAWRAKRGEELQRQFEEDEAAMEELMAMVLADTEVMETHRQAATEILALANSVTDLTRITVVSDHVSAEFELEEGYSEEEMIHALCWALEEGGGITLRQRLALRSQVRGEDGTMNWVHQERIYGIACGEGQWQGVTAAQMRHAYTHKPDGTPLAVDASTTFGNAQDLVRKAKPGRARH